MYNQWLPSSKDSTFMILKKQRQQKTDTKGLTVRHCNFFHVQIHCACQWIMTLPPKILWPTALLNTWNIITFPKSSFYHTNHTFLTNINVWMMDFGSINTRIKKNSSAQNTILCREWLLQKLTFRHSEITIFNHSQYPTQRTFGEPPAPSVYIYILHDTCCFQYVLYRWFCWTSSITISFQRYHVYLVDHLWFVQMCGDLPIHHRFPLP